MNSALTKSIAMLVVAGALSACASSPDGDSIYVPMGGGDAKAPEPPRVTIEPDEPRVERKSEQPAPTTERRSPSYQESGDALSPAARSLIQKAENLLAAGDAQAAVGQLERAQRIAPRSAAVYFGLSEAYRALNQLGSAEQFALKGLSLAGNDGVAQRAGWLLLADIRQARGNVAGADQARERAARL